MGTIKSFCGIEWNAIRAGKNNTWVNDLKILQQMRSHAFLPIIIQWNDYVPLLRLTSEIKGSGFGKSLNIESFPTIPHVVYFNKTCVRRQ